MEAVLQWLGKNWGNVASIAGLVVTFVGLWIAIVQVRKTKEAAVAAKEAAESAAHEAKQAIATNLTIQDIQNVIDLIERVKSYHRANKWDIVVEWYPLLRSTIAEIRGRHPSLNHLQQDTLQEAISQVKIVEDDVDLAIRNSHVPANADSFNSTLTSIQIDLQSLVSKLHL